MNGGLIVLMMISFSLNFLTFQILTDFSGFSVHMDGYVPLVSEKWSKLHMDRAETHLYVGSVPREPLFSEPLTPTQCHGGAKSQPTLGVLPGTE